MGSVTLADYIALWRAPQSAHELLGIDVPLDFLPSWLRNRERYAGLETPEIDRHWSLLTREFVAFWRVQHGLYRKFDARWDWSHRTALYLVVGLMMVEWHAARSLRRYGAAYTIWTHTMSVMQPRRPSQIPFMIMQVSLLGPECSAWEVLEAVVEAANSGTVRSAPPVRLSDHPEDPPTSR